MFIDKWMNNKLSYYKLNNCLYNNVCPLYNKRRDFQVSYIIGEAVIMSEFTSLDAEELKDLEDLKQLEEIEELSEFLLDFNAESVAEITEKVDALTEKKKTFKEMMNIEVETMRMYYSCARDVMTQKKYKDSSNAFLFLTMLDPYIYDFWVGLGLSEQHNGKYQYALKAYGMAALTNLDHPAPHFFAAQCCLQLKNEEDALQCLEAALETSKKKDEYQDFYKQSMNLKRTLDK